MVRQSLTLLALVLGPFAMCWGGQEYSHQKYYEHYEGTKTCLKCHTKQAKSFFSSQHYQWRGDTPALVNAHQGQHGKLTMINDFCTNPKPNWIGKEINAEGKVIGKGCSGCHAGFGTLPSSELSREQLENIDCLVCHASGYRRDLYEREGGGWEWRSILWKNQEGLDSVSKRISLPTKTMCLRCHSASGGGPNFKRGDLSYELTECAPDHDVHMAVDGPNLECIDCHAGEDHRVVGRGADLASTDTPGVRLLCDNDDCHTTDAHSQELLNRHAKRVNCTVCHIPEYAKADPTDVYRNWSNVTFSEEKGKYAPEIELAGSLTPTYAWFNGTTWAQLPGEPVRQDDNGVVQMMIPQGSRQDPAARIHAFKVHRAKLPMLKDKHWLLPIKTEELYIHGDVGKAVQDAAQFYYGIEDAEFTWVETVRYMGLFHEVAPARDALRCLDCHGPDGRLNWQELGYDDDPLAGCL